MTDIAPVRQNTILVNLPNGMVFLSKSAREQKRVKEIVSEVLAAKLSSHPNAKEGPFTNVAKAEIVARRLKNLDYLTAFQLSDLYASDSDVLQIITYYLDLRVQILKRIADEKIFREELAVYTVLRQSIYYSIQARALLDLRFMAQNTRVKH